MDEWAASSGMTCKQLAQLERDFLKAIDWELYTSESSFWKKLNDIEVQLAVKEGNSRGYFTYTELETLGNLIDLHTIVQCLVAMSVILVAAYTAAFLTLLGSVTLASTIPGTCLYQRQNKFIAIDDSLVKVKDIPLPSVDNQTKTTTFTEQPNILNNVNAIKVFKATILLASIKSDSPKNTSEKSCGLCQYVTWDWWNVPVMTWLTKTSEYIKTFEIPAIQSYVYFLENTIANEKSVYLEDHIQKATKTRIQDQLERSWHVEWTETIKQQLPYLRTIKP